MTEYVEARESEGWLCAVCGVPLEMGRVEIAYMGNKFPAELPRCPTCGVVFIPEHLALGKMAEVEKILEDK